DISCIKTSEVITLSLHDALPILMYLNQYGYDERNSKVKRVVTMGAPFNDVEVGKRTPYIEDHPLTTTGPVEMSPLYRWMKVNNRSEERRVGKECRKLWSTADTEE